MLFMQKKPTASSRPDKESAPGFHSHPSGMKPGRNAIKINQIKDMTKEEERSICEAERDEKSVCECVDARKRRQ